ncbi:MAG: hypothetical protein EAZ15_03770 [Sphingobacteriales bacterium]|nr:MAG: hypothetical protein EAZ15_03770 [Sphingobacteriales bacterium]
MGYLSVDELFLIDSVKADTQIVGISYYRWHNLSIPKNAYIFIDKIELSFNNIASILLEINETDDGISLKTNYNVAQEIKDVESNFNSQIKITCTNEDKNPMWLNVINAPLLGIEAEQEQNFYLNGVLLFNFGEEKRTVTFDIEKGILIDYYEED